MKAVAAITAIGREASYTQFTPSGRFSSIKVPPTGTLILLVVYVAFVLVLEFANNNGAGVLKYTSMGIRAAWLAVAQVPLLILLAGKNNLIGLASGISYERLNVLHRWVSRVLFLLATFHVIFLHVAWNKYDLGPVEYATDSCIPTGWAVYAILIWMNISSVAPIRNFSYEFFVIQHVLTFFGFIIAVMWHLPEPYSRVYIYIPVALYLVDRIIRAARYAYNNIRPGRATLVAMEGGVTRITIESRQLKKWTPGSHVFLSIPKFGPGQSHPATIASVPTSHDGQLVLILKGHKGFTSRLLKSATDSRTPLIPTATSGESSLAPEQTHIALLDGPYGGTHPDFAAFDTVLLIAGSTGVTFTLPILLDIASRAHAQRLPIRRLQFLWIVKNTSWTSWISSDLQPAFTALRDAGIEVLISVYVTCDDAWTTAEESGASKECGCACDKSLGPCCCISADPEDDVADDITRATSKAEIDEKGTTVAIASRRSSRSGSRAGNSSVLPCAMFTSGRPDFYPLLWDLLDMAEGETGVAVCGPLGLSSTVRRVVARCSDERAVHKGTGAQGIFLHAECFGW